MLANHKDIECIAYDKFKKIAQGSIIEVAEKAKKYLEKNKNCEILFFNMKTSEPVEIDLRGSVDTVIKRLSVNAEAANEKPAVGRPKLGVVAREITLMPEHWQWLAIQPGGASVAIRKLVDDAKKKTAVKDQIRFAQDVTYKFMQAIAGDLPNYEEALRALYASKKADFKKSIEAWPKDIFLHIEQISKPAF